MLRALPLAALLSASAAAAGEPGLWDRWLAADKVGWLDKSVHLALVYGVIDGPLVRGSDGHTEMAIGKSFGQYGLKLSATIVPADAIALEAGVLFFRGTDLETFTFQDATTGLAGTTTTYSQPRYGLWQFDLQLHVAPWRAVPFSLYGVAGLGARSFSYTASGSLFAQDDGAHDDTEFVYSYGLGVRAFPLPYVSAFAEWRLAPGDLVTTCDQPGEYIDATHYYCAPGHESQSSRATTLWLVGVGVHLP